MTHHMTSRNYKTEAERNDKEQMLKQNGYRQVVSTYSPGDREYRLFEGTTDPERFEGDPLFGIEWCEDK